MQAFVHVMGGVLPGIYLEDVQPPRSEWLSNQGAFITVYAPEAFADKDVFAGEMTR